MIGNSPPTGFATALTEQRTATLDAAFAAHPHRFKHIAPQPPRMPTAAWINRPKEYTAPITINACSLNS